MEHKMSGFNYFKGMKDNMWEEANAILWKLTRGVWKKNLKTVIIKTQTKWVC